MNYWMKKPFIMDEAGDDGGDGGGGAGDVKDKKADASGDDDDSDRGDKVSSGDDDGDDGAEDKKAAGKKADDKKDDEVLIPKARFDEALRKERQAREALEKRLADAEDLKKAEGEAVDTEKLQNEIDALEDKYEGLMTEGTAEDRKNLRKQIRTKERELAEAKATARANYATALAVEQMRYDAQVVQVEKDYPFLNQDLDAFNNEMAGEVLDLKSAYEAAGMASSEALKKAVKLLKPQLDKLLESTSGKGEEDNKGKGKDDVKAAEDAAKRRAEAVARGVDARGKQPPEPGGGKQGPAPKHLEVTKLSDKQFDELDEKQLAQLRGDDI
jgi:hypothetical protein